MITLFILIDEILAFKLLKKNNKKIINTWDNKTTIIDIESNHNFNVI